MITPDAIKGRARELGFDLCGIAPATDLPELARLEEWLDRGFAGEMIYMHKSAERRADIRNVLPSAKSVIVTGTVYYTEGGAKAPPAADHTDGGAKAPPSADHTKAPPATDHTAAGGRAFSPADSAVAGRIARYAWGEDYHIVLAERLQQLVDWMGEQQGEPFDASIFVDKHHVQERVFATHAGLGWVGKNTCLINHELGSWLFLAGVAVSLELPTDGLAADQCGACTLCLDACPTGALVDEYQLDATKCISYLTIETKTPIPEAQRASIGDHIYGCDICQDVCPWNLAATPTADPAWQPRGGRAHANAAELWQRSDFDLHALVAGSAMTRTSLSRLRRNLAVVLANSGDSATVEILERPGGGIRRAAQSAETDLVRAHVAWATDVLQGRG